MAATKEHSRGKLSISVAFVMVTAAVAVAVGGAPASARPADLQPYSIDEELASLSPSEVGLDAGPEATHFSDPSMTLDLYSWDPENPGAHSVEFTKEGESEDAVIYIGRDDLCTDYGRCDTITPEQVQYMLDTFQSSIYDQMQPIFGSPAPRPADDEDGKKIAILVYNIRDENFYDPDFGSYIAGFFWSGLNEMLQMNAVFIDSYDWANRMGPDSARPYLYEGVLAHEFEHLLHYDQDPDEATFVDEGLADLAAYLTGFGHSSGHIAYYLVFHRDSLTHWGGSLIDYGSGYLFQLYLYEKFGGEDFVRDLVQEQADGMEGIQNVLDARGAGVSVEEVFHDWTIANLLDDASLGDEYHYETLAIGSDDTWGYTIPWSMKHVYGTDYHGKLPEDRKDPQVHAEDVVAPWAANYQSLKGSNAKALEVVFDGDDEAGVAPGDGSAWEWWGGNANELYNSLAQDVTLGTGGALTFDTWYAIEVDWDYAYVQVSTDGGSSWTNVPGAITTNTDPNGNNLGNGITGFSNGWQSVTFDLSAYSGPVTLRFAYVTDAAVTETGIFLDNIVVSDDSGTVLSDDVESGEGGWAADGFVRTTGLVANDFGLQYVLPTSGGTSIGTVALDGDTESGSAVLDTTKVRGQDLLYFVVTNTPDPVAGTFGTGYELRWTPA